MSEEQARNETLIRFEDAVEQLGIKSWGLVNRMREAGLLVRLNFPEESRYDWQAEAFWVKTRLETVHLGGCDEHGDPILKRDENGEPLLWEKRESVWKSLSIPGRAVVTLKGMEHLAESLREGLLGFDLLPGLEVIPEGRQETLEHVVWRELGDEPPWTLASPGHPGIVTLERLLRPTEQERETGIKPPRLEVLKRDLLKIRPQGRKLQGFQGRRSNTSETNAYQELLERTLTERNSAGRPLNWKRVLDSLKHHLEEGDSLDTTGGGVCLTIAAGTDDKEVIKRKPRTFKHDLTAHRKAAKQISVSD